ncbi:hypothetical protein ACEWY4_024485 [Coilia grayii]|uniref:Uncharacterized protein n=1 Tax=Coilia grayii TaxID=363190 RepID=A0ABD1J0K5_9TELE
MANPLPGTLPRSLTCQCSRCGRPVPGSPAVLLVDSSSSFLEHLFGDWVKQGTVIRLDIRHWLHRWDAVVKQSHAKYGTFMSAMAGAVMAYKRADMMLLIQAVRFGNSEMYDRYTKQEMMAFLKPHQETAMVVESILTELRGPAGLDIDGIHLFKSTEAVDAHWAVASKHLSCMQDPPGVQLYVSVKVVEMNGIRLNKYRCRRGSNSLEGLHAHLFNAIPSQHCGITPFQIQRVNQQAEFLFGKEHVLEPNIAAPMPVPKAYEHPDEEELLGVEYAMCQSTSFTARDYYVQKVEEEQLCEEEEKEEEQDDDETVDEGVGMSSDAEEDPIDRVREQHVVLTQAINAEEEDSPALQDVSMTHRHLHLPANSLHDHDKTAARFAKQYESRWGYTLFRRCLGVDSPETRAAQKTKFGWMRYAQAAQVTEDRRLLYLLLKMLKHRTPANQLVSPSKVTVSLKGQYKRIADRVRDDPILSGLAISLPNINAKSISTFISREEKKANYAATVRPEVTPHLKVLSDMPFLEAPALPSSLPPSDRPQVQYQHVHHEAGKRRGEKRRPPAPTPLQPRPPAPTPIQPRPPAAYTYGPPPMSAAPILLVLPTQPQAPSVLYRGPSCSQTFVPPEPTVKVSMPNKSTRPCGACNVPNCGGQWKRYTPSKDKVAGSTQKIFCFCPSTRKSITPDFDNVVYDNFEHFKSVVDAKRRTV